MKKKIILIFSHCIVAIIFCLIGFFIGNNANNEENKNDLVNKAVGVYHNNNWNKREATLTLNEDFTCEYPDSSDTCEWSIGGKEITITLTSYILNKNNTSFSFFGDKTTCEQALNEELKSKKWECVQTESTHNATLVNNGVILHEHQFEKVG